MFIKFQTLFNTILENTVGTAGINGMSGAGNTDFSAFNAPNPNSAYSPATFDKSSIKGDYAANKLSIAMTAKNKKKKKPIKRTFPELAIAKIQRR
jgi:hypothetical protein